MKFWWNFHSTTRFPSGYNIILHPISLSPSILITASFCWKTNTQLSAGYLPFDCQLMKLMMFIKMWKIPKSILNYWFTKAHRIYCAPMKTPFSVVIMVLSFSKPSGRKSSKAHIYPTDPINIFLWPREHTQNFKCLVNHIRYYYRNIRKHLSTLLFREC